MTYGIPGSFQPQFEGQPSQVQWETRPGFAAARGRVGGYALGAEVSFINSGLSATELPALDTAIPPRGSVPQGVVGDPYGSLGGPRIFGESSFTTTSSPDSALSSPESLPDGVVSMGLSREQREFNERYGVNPKTGKMSKEGFALYTQDQTAAQHNSRGWQGQSTPRKNEAAKHAAWAAGARDGGRRAQEQVRGSVSETKSPVQENHDGTRRLFQRRRDG